MLDESFVEGGGGFVKDASPIPPAGGFSLSLEWGFVADASPAGGGGFVADASPTPPAVVFSLSLGWSFVADASPAGGGGGFVADASPTPPAVVFSLSLGWSFVADASPAGGGGGFVADASLTPPAVVFSLSFGWSFVADASPAGVVPMPFWSLSAAPNGGLVFSDISGLGFFGVARRCCSFFGQLLSSNLFIVSKCFLSFWALFQASQVTVPEQPSPANWWLVAAFEPFVVALSAFKEVFKLAAASGPELAITVKKGGGAHYIAYDQP